AGRSQRSKRRARTPASSAPISAPPMATTTSNSTFGRSAKPFERCPRMSARDSLMQVTTFGWTPPDGRVPALNALTVPAPCRRRACARRLPPSGCDRSSPRIRTESVSSHGPLRAGSARGDSFRGDDLRDVGQNSCHALLVECTLVEGVIRFHLQALIQQHGDGGVLGELVVLRTGRRHDRQINVLDAVLRDEIPEACFGRVIFTQDDHDSPQLGGLPGDEFRIQLRDQACQGLVHLPGKDQDHGVLTVTLNEVHSLAHVTRIDRMSDDGIQRTRQVVAWLQPGLEIAGLRGRRVSKTQEAPYENGEQLSNDHGMSPDEKLGRSSPFRFTYG